MLLGEHQAGKGRLKYSREEDSDRSWRLSCGGELEEGSGLFNFAKHMRIETKISDLL